MVNYADLKHLFSLRKQIKELADDENYCELILDYFNNNPDAREDMPDIYVRALKSLEKKTKSQR